MGSYIDLKNISKIIDVLKKHNIELPDIVVGSIDNFSLHIKDKKVLNELISKGLGELTSKDDDWGGCGNFTIW